MPSFPSLWDFGLAGSYACFVKVTKAGLSSWMKQSHGILKPALHSPPPTLQPLHPVFLLFCKGTIYFDSWFQRGSVHDGGERGGRTHGGGSLRLQLFTVWRTRKEARVGGVVVGCYLKAYPSHLLLPAKPHLTSCSKHEPIKGFSDF